mgnify:CR=1 FL=1
MTNLYAKAFCITVSIYDCPWSLMIITFYFICVHLHIVKCFDSVLG